MIKLCKKKSDSPRYSPDADDKDALSATICKFSARFCNELEKNKNVVSSPLSAELVLALLTLGSTDPARQQLLDSLGFTDDDSIRSVFPEVLSKLKKKNKSVTLKIANKVYIKEGSYDLQPQLKRDAVKIFDAAMEKVDFNNGETAAKKINTWVEKQTKHKIKNLVSKDGFGRDTGLVLVNAIYFKGAWKYPFQRQFTEDLPFHLNATSSVQVPMMCKKTDFVYGYSKHLQAQLLEIPFKGDVAKMVIVLPQAIEGLNDVLGKLAAGHDLISDIKTATHIIEVTVSIPKMKIETEIDLKELLPKLGISSIFECNNSGLTKLLNNGESLYVSTAVQKAFIEVNEEGAAAAAGTYANYQLLCYRPSAIFRADRPFLYLLLDACRTPLFIGVYRGVD